MELKDYGTLHFTRNGIDKQQKFSVSWPVKGGGNADKLVIRCEGDQFDIAEWKKVPNGFELTVYGAWETAEFLTSMAQAATAYGVGEFWLKDEK